MTASATHNRGERATRAQPPVSRLELSSWRPWTEEERARFLEARSWATHLGEAAEAIGRTVQEVQTEFDIGPLRQFVIIPRQRRAQRHG